MNERIHFEEFTRPSADDWKHAIQKELGEKSYESLIWKPFEGISIDPYFGTVRKKLKHVVKPPSEFSIGFSLAFKDETTSNADILEALAKGANFITVTFAHSPGNIRWETLFQGVMLDFIHIRLRTGRFSPGIISSLCTFLSEQAHEKANFSLLESELPFLSKEEINHRIQFYQSTHQRHQVFGVDAAAIQNKGGNVAQALLHALSGGEILLRNMAENGISADDASAMMRFNFATDVSYYLEIAKLQVHRIIWAEIMRTFAPRHSCSIHTLIDSETCSFSLAGLDIENNILRATTAGMSAMIGKSDSYTPVPYDGMVTSKRENASRIALNIIHLLNEESSFGQLGDASEGSYYLESLMVQLAETTVEALHLVAGKSAEERRDLLDEDVEKYREMSLGQFESGKKVILGVNKYVNPKDKDKGNSDSGSNPSRISAAREKILREEVTQ